MPYKYSFRILIIICAGCLFTISSCKKESYTPDFKEKLEGHYINPEYSGQYIDFEKAAKLKEKIYGISLLENNQLVERRNIGFCGTPPVIYGDYPGTWELQDSVISLKIQLDEGYIEHKWKILKLDNASLKVLILSQRNPDIVL